MAACHRLLALLLALAACDAALVSRVAGVGAPPRPARASHCRARTRLSDPEMEELERRREEAMRLSPDERRSMAKKMLQEWAERKQEQTRVAKGPQSVVAPPPTMPAAQSAYAPPAPSGPTVTQGGVIAADSFASIAAGGAVPAASAPRPAPVVVPPPAPPPRVQPPPPPPVAAPAAAGPSAAASPLAQGGVVSADSFADLAGNAAAAAGRAPPASPAPPAARAQPPAPAAVPVTALIDSLATWAHYGGAGMSRAQLQQLLSDLSRAQAQLEADVVAKRALELLAQWRAGPPLSAADKSELAAALDTVKQSIAQ